MIATLVLAAGGAVLIFASGGSVAAFLVGGLLCVIAGYRVTLGRHVDNTPVTRDEMKRWTRRHGGK